MTVSQAAYHFDVSERTIRRWIESGKLTANREDGQWIINSDGIPADKTPSHADIVSTLKQQISVKDEQISQLQSALDQSQRLQALAESRHQAEQQQLAEIRGRSLLQRLKAVLVANP
jgi:excisionase family DNA binding protein